jgi:hypothetical protein
VLIRTTIQMMPAARQIQPIGFPGRSEAIRAPTKGKARKGNGKMSTALSPPVPQLLGDCPGSGGDVQRDAHSAQDEREAG